jgi:hypothetical protein
MIAYALEINYRMNAKIPTCNDGGLLRNLRESKLVVGEKTKGIPQSRVSNGT